MVEHPAAPNLDCDHITLQHSLHMRRLRWIQSRGGGDGRRAIRSERVASSGRIVCDCAPATAVAAAVTAAVAAAVAAAAAAAAAAATAAAAAAAAVAAATVAAAAVSIAAVAAKGMHAREGVSQCVCFCARLAQSMSDGEEQGQRVAAAVHVITHGVGEAGPTTDQRQREVLDE